MDKSWELSEAQKISNEILLDIQVTEMTGFIDLRLMRDRNLGVKAEAGRFSSGKKWFRDEEFFGREILDLSPNVTKLELKGGEPLLIKEVRPLLQSFVDRGTARDLELVIVTSGTIASGAVYDLLPRFRGISIIISLDGVGDVNDYIRYGSSWTDIQKNIKKFMNLPNTAVSVNTTFQAYNMLHVTAIADYACRMGIGMSCNFLAEPDQLSCFAMPNAALVEAEARIRNYLSTSSFKNTENFERIRLVLLDVIKGLASGREICTPQLLGKFVEFTKDLDQARNQDFSTVNPKLCELIEKSGIQWKAGLEMVH